MLDVNLCLGAESWFKSKTFYAETGNWNRGEIPHENKTPQHAKDYKQVIILLLLEYLLGSEQI